MARPAIHPGEHLAEQLEALGMSAAALARQLKVPTNRITHILNGQRAITGDTALRLGHFFGTSAEFWLNLQKIYELRVAERELGADIRKLPRLRDRAASRRKPPGLDSAGTPAGTGEFPAARVPCTVKALPQSVQLRPGAPEPSYHAVSGELNMLAEVYKNRHFVAVLVL